mgnify:CR=1 FL=1
MKKIFLAALGLISLGLGIIGIVVPGLPTTPFLLLSSFLFLKSSARLYNRLNNHRILGAYIKSFREHGFTLKKRVISISVMWLMILMSVIFLINNNKVKIIVLSFGFIGTLAMTFYKNKTS